MAHFLSELALLLLRLPICLVMAMLGGALSGGGAAWVMLSNVHCITVSVVRRVCGAQANNHSTSSGMGTGSCSSSEQQQEQQQWEEEGLAREEGPRADPAAGQHLAPGLGQGLLVERVVERDGDAASQSEGMEAGRACASANSATGSASCSLHSSTTGCSDEAAAGCPCACVVVQGGCSEGSQVWGAEQKMFGA